MDHILKGKTKESVSAVLPITGVVLFLAVLLVPLEPVKIILFLIGAVLLTVGMGFFQLGAEMAMTPIGENIGTHISKTKNIVFVLFISFLAEIDARAQKMKSVLTKQMAEH